MKQTSAEGYGQIYVGTVNWILMAATIGLTLLFRKSDNLASAYGIAVSLTMTLTTVLLFRAMREVLGWRRWVATAAALAFLAVDLVFVAANAVKIAEGGYVPLLIAAAVYGVMWVWHSGAEAVEQRLNEGSTTIADLEKEQLARLPRVPGTGVFLTRSDIDAPPVLLWHIEHNKALHEKVLVLTVTVATTPYVAPAERLSIEEIGARFWRAKANIGFMDDVALVPLLEAARRQGCGVDLDDVTYYVGHATIVPRRDGTGLWRWHEALFAAMARNALHIGDVLRLPQEHTVELGRQIAI